MPHPDPASLATLVQRIPPQPPEVTLFKGLGHVPFCCTSSAHSCAEVYVESSRPSRRGRAKPALYNVELLEDAKMCLVPQRSRSMPGARAVWEPLKAENVPGTMSYDRWPGASGKPTKATTWLGLPPQGLEALRGSRIT